MKYKKVEFNNKELIRINRKKVDNILQNYTKYLGLVIYIAPINMRIDDTSRWTSPIELELNQYMDYYDYMNCISEIRYYNCNKELGDYLKYYIELN